MARIYFILLICLLLTAACSPRVDEAATQTAEVATLVHQQMLDIQASAQAAASQTVAAMPSPTPTASPSPSNTPP